MCIPTCASVPQRASAGVQVVGGDADKDVAVLQLDMPREKMDALKPIALGTSTNLLVGQKVVATVKSFALLLT